VQFDKEASQTRDYCAARARRIARLAQILRYAKERLLRMTSKPHRYHVALEFVPHARGRCKLRFEPCARSSDG
jgi:hypothetical protein